MRRVGDRRRGANERGSIMVMATAGIVVMIISAAFSIDIGRLTVAKRGTQSVADMAALDAVRDMANAVEVARASAVRNDFDPDAPGNTIVVELGSMDAANTFMPGAGSSAVRVTTSTVVDYKFRPQQRTVTSSAVASLRELAGFSIGSTLATVSTSQRTLLNALVGRWLGGNVNLTLVSWQGLVNSSITLQALWTELVNLGVQAGSVDELMGTEVTAFQFYKASANALSNSGQTVAASAMDSLALSASGSRRLTVGELFSISQGQSGAALGMALNAYQLVTASAAVANGTNAVSLSPVGISVPNVTNTTLSLTVIEAPRFVFGPVGSSVTTAQVQLTLSPTLNLPVNILGLTEARVTNTLPVTVTAGGATGTIEAISCGDPKGMTVGVTPEPATVASSGVVRLSARVLFVVLPLLDITVNGTYPIVGTHTSLPFAYPQEFSPPAGTKHVGSTSVGFNGIPYTAGQVTVLNAVGVNLGLMVSTVVGALAPAMANVDSLIVSPLLSALGLEVGAADVAALALSCDGFALVR